MRTILFLLLIHSFSAVFGQSSNVPSLKHKLLGAKNDSTKTQILLEIADLYVYNDLDSFFFFANEALKISSIQIMLKKKSSPFFVNAKGKALNKISYYHFQKGEITKAKVLAQEAIKELISVQDNRELSACYDNMGAYLESEGKSKEAEEHFEKSLHCAELSKDSLGIANSYNSLAFMYNNSGEVIKSLEYFEKALAIQQKINEKVGIANSYYNIGIVYTKQDEIKNGIEYLNKAAKEFEKLGDKQAMANVYMGLFNANRRLNNKGEFESYLNKAIVLLRELGDKKNLSECLNSLAVLEIGRKNYMKAEQITKEALSIVTELGYKKGLCSTLNNLSLIYFNRDKNFNKSESLSLQAFKIAREIGYLSLVKESSNSLKNMYQKKGDFKNAFKYQAITIALEDSLKNDDTKKVAIKQKFKIEYENKENNLKKQSEFEKQSLIQKNESEKKNQRLIIYFVSSGMLLLLIIVFIVLHNLKINKNKNAIIEKQKQHLVDKQKEILDSITYARHLQRAILPPLNMIKRLLPDSFVLYKPKDIVAGDFYWLEQKGDFIFIAVADCTGHGVPGAMVSVVCGNALHRALNEFKADETGLLLDKTCELVLETFAKSENEIKDGMDISLCRINKKTREVLWSGANNPLWIISDSVLKECKADKQPIGLTYNPKPFTTHRFILNSGDILYMFSDGFADQFGGEKGKKFKYKALKELLIVNSFDLTECENHLSLALSQWKGELEQVDDVCIIGIRL